jgi:hypothetical protein
MLATLAMGRWCTMETSEHTEIAGSTYPLDLPACPTTPPSSRIRSATYALVRCSQPRCHNPSPRESVSRCRLAVYCRCILRAILNRSREGRHDAGSMSNYSRWPHPSIADRVTTLSKVSRQRVARR